MPEQGILPRQELLELIDAGILKIPLRNEQQLQPSSIDLALGEHVRCIRTSFLPAPGEDMDELLDRLAFYDFSLEEGVKHKFMKDQIYVAEYEGTIALPKGFFGCINPKSSTGRGDLMTRVLVSGEQKFDTINPGDMKKLYGECVPLSGTTTVQRGLTLNQLRIGYGQTLVDEASLKIKYAGEPLLHDEHEKPIPINDANFRSGGLEMTVDLRSEIVGYRRKKTTAVDYDISAGRGEMAAHRDAIWEPIERPRSGELILEPNEFYLLSTKEGIRFPPHLCGVLEAYDVTSTEGRVHYAGFFDPGFGYGAAGELPAAAATLEVRIHHAPFRIVHGQPICIMRFHNMRDVPRDREGKIAAYGTGMYAGSSNYRRQRGVVLPKQFL